MTKITLTAALILATLSGCATTLPIAPLARPTQRVAAAKAQLTAKVASAKTKVAERLAPSVMVLKGAAAAVQTEEAAAAQVDGDVDTTLDAFEAFADEQGGYQLQGLGGLGWLPTMRAKIKARVFAWGILRHEVRRKLVVRAAARHKLVKAKLAHREDVRRAFRAVPWSDNGDGTQTKAIDYSMEVKAGGKTFARQVKGTITVDAETKALITAQGEFTQQMPNGASLTASSDKTLQADGAYLVKRTSLTTLKDGTTRAADATRTIDTDGHFAGTGTITWKNAAGAVIATKTWTFGGNEDTADLDELEPVTGDEAAEEPAAVDPVATAAQP